MHPMTKWWEESALSKRVASEAGDLADALQDAACFAIEAQQDWSICVAGALQEIGDQFDALNHALASKSQRRARKPGTPSAALKLACDCAELLRLEPLTIALQALKRGFEGQEHDLVAGRVQLLGMVDRLRRQKATAKRSPAFTQN